MILPVNSVDRNYYQNINQSKNIYTTRTTQTPVFTGNIFSGFFKRFLAKDVPVKDVFLYPELSKSTVSKVEELFNNFDKLEKLHNERGKLYLFLLSPGKFFLESKISKDSAKHVLSLSQKLKPSNIKFIKNGNRLDLQTVFDNENYDIGLLLRKRGETKITRQDGYQVILPKGKNENVVNIVSYKAGNDKKITKPEELMSTTMPWYIKNIIIEDSVNRINKYASDIKM